MLIEQLKYKLGPLNIHLDLKILQQLVETYPQIKPNRIRHTQSNIYLYALTAAICQTERLPSVTDRHLVKTGFSIQNILQHVPQAEKACFLEHVKQISGLEQFRDGVRLKNKIQQVLRAYAIYQKYQRSFELLSEQLNTEIFISKKHISIFWMVYLYVKQQSHPIKQIKQDKSLEIITTLLKYIFTQVIPYHHQSIKIDSIVDDILKLQFQDVPMVSQGKKRQYIGRFHEILKKQYEFRYDGGQFTMECFIRKNMHFVDRFLDDMTNHYQGKYNNVQNDLVDEVTFIQLDKTLAPQGIKKGQCLQPISRPLNFNADDSIDIDSSNKSQRQEIINIDTFSKNNNYNFQTRLHDSQNNVIVQDHFTQKAEHMKIAVIEETTVMLQQHSSRLQNLEWINSKIQEVSFQDECVVNKMFQNYTDISLGEYWKINEKKLVNLLEIYVPNCLDKVKRANNILKLFINFINKVQITLNYETQDIFINRQSFDAFLFITTIIFNFSYKCTSIDYEQYCSLFNISKISGYIPINWLGYHVDLPGKVKKYLFELEQSILFCQLWKDESAMEILRSRTQASYRYFSMKKRLLLHINAKIYQTCADMICEKDKSKIYVFFEQLFEKKTDLFHYNNIDIILSCSIYYCYGKIIPFSTIITKNHRLDYHNLQAYDNENTKISFYDYYELIFLKQADNLQSSSKKYSIFCTPKTIGSEASQKKDKKSYDFEMRITSLTLGNLTKLQLNQNGTYRERLRDQYVKNEAKCITIKQDGFLAQN